MSKTAIAVLKKAESIIASSGVVVDLVSYLNEGKTRSVNGKKLWRNADKLAALIVDSAANAFQTENTGTFPENMFDNMEQAVDRYVMSNLDSWSQVELEGCHSFFAVDQLARLAEMVARNVAFEKKETDHAETLVVDDAEMSRRCRDAVFFGSLDSFGRRVIVEAAHGEALAFNEEFDEAAAADQWDEWANQHDSRKTEAQMIESDHAEALEMNVAECDDSNDFVDTSIFQGVCQFTVKGREFRLEGRDLFIRENEKRDFVWVAALTLPNSKASNPVAIYQAYINLNF